MTRSPGIYLAAAIVGVASALAFAALMPGYGRADGPVLVTLGPGAGIHLVDVLLCVVFALLSMGLVHRLTDR